MTALNHRNDLRYLRKQWKTNQIFHTLMYPRATTEKIV